MLWDHGRDSICPVSDSPGNGGNAFVAPSREHQRLLSAHHVHRPSVSEHARQRDGRKLYQNGRSEERDRSDCCCGAL